MLAKLVSAHIDPESICSATDAVADELVPAVLAHPGALKAFWMVHPTSGRVLAMTSWSDAASLLAGQAADGSERAQIAERIGLRVETVQTLEIVAAHEPPADDLDNLWVRATCFEGIAADRIDHLREVYDQTLSDQLRAGGFRGSYWLADREARHGLALSFWSESTDLSRGELNSRRRRHQVERTLGCTVNLIAEYRAIGYATNSTTDRRTRERSSAN
ncbi:hypothetical protein BH10ACT3_BH10ACT3_19170 [soil metagenome]